MSSFHDLIFEKAVALEKAHLMLVHDEDRWWKEWLNTGQRFVTAPCTYCDGTGERWIPASPFDVAFGGMKRGQLRNIGCWDCANTGEVLKAWDR